jgi:hypothetical protein
VAVLREEGYDALEITDEPFPVTVGGSQIVVFDPQAVVVIDDG